MEYPTAKVRLAEGCASLEVRCIYTWDRGFMAAFDSNGSGPKDSIRNQVFSLFESNPDIDRIVLCRASTVPFILMRDRQNYWFDSTGKQVVVAA